MIVNIPQELGYGLTKYMADNGATLFQRGDIWYAEGHADPQSLIDSYNPWPSEKFAKFAEIDAAFDKAVAALTVGWPVHEQQTWPKQETEARALQADANAPTPMLSSIAATRGLTTAELATRVLRDADAFTNASARYVGMRHKARQLVQALPDSGRHERLAELWAIKFGGQ